MQGIFLKQLPQILLMAFPAMIVASVLTALCIFALAPATWTFWVCWLIGVILSATDPVAVVALLKELGAAKSLGARPRRASSNLAAARRARPGLSARSAHG